MDSNYCNLIASEIEAHLAGIPVQVYSSLPSTNTFAKHLVVPKGGKTRVIIARTQTDGRGRFGKSFWSPSGGLYMSVLFYPNYSLEKAQKLTFAAAVSVCEAIEKFTDYKPNIKWVNDVLIDGRKVCGVLTESISCENVNAVIIGVGVNMFQAAFPLDISETACALNHEGLDVNAFAADIAKSIIKLSETPDSPETVNSYYSRLIDREEHEL